MRLPQNCLSVGPGREGRERSRVQVGDPRGDGVDCGHAWPWSAMAEPPDRGRSGYRGFVGGGSGVIRPGLMLHAA